MDIFDVAKACQVSKSTVSRVLNNHPYVSEEKRQRVLKYIEENNYVPNHIATYFKNKTTRSIAISIPYIDHPFFSQVAYELTKNFNAQGYKSFIHQTFCAPAREEEILVALKKNEIDAVILCSVENEKQVIEAYAEHGLIISSNDTKQTSKISNFHFDEYQIGKTATEFLIQKGCSNVAICMDNPFNHAQKLRLAGYKKALKKHALTYNEGYVFSSAFTIDDGMKIGRNIKEMYPNIDGIYTGNDYVSAGIQKVLEDKVVLIGTDNHDICKITRPQLSSIALPVAQMAEDISNHVVECLVTSNKETLNQQYDFDLIVR